MAQQYHIFPDFPSGQGFVVPQLVFATPANQGVFIPHPTIRFFDNSTGLHGIALSKALQEDCAGLTDWNTRPHTGGAHRFNLRIQWPGYNAWADTINSREAGGSAINQPLTKGKLATAVARRIGDFHRDMSTVASFDPDPSWWLQNRPMQGLVLLELRHVAQGSWQPVIVWRGI